MSFLKYLKNHFFIGVKFLDFYFIYMEIIYFNIHGPAAVISPVIDAWSIVPKILSEFQNHQKIRTLKVVNNNFDEIPLENRVTHNPMGIQSVCVFS